MKKTGLLILAIAVSLSFVFVQGGFSAEKPAVCSKYFGDQYCDDSLADCGSNNYIKDLSVDDCDECQSGGFECTKTTTSSKPSKCSQYFGDSICDDSQVDCGKDYKPGISLDACDECQADGFKCGVSAKQEYTERGFYTILGLYSEGGIPMISAGYGPYAVEVTNVTNSTPYYNESAVVIEIKERLSGKVVDTLFLRKLSGSDAIVSGMRIFLIDFRVNGTRVAADIAYGTAREVCTIT